MKTEEAPGSSERAARRKAIALAVIGISAFIAITLAQLSRFYIGGSATIQIGNVALLDIRSPRRITYASDSETTRQRDLAEASVAPLFTAPDAQIARQQLGAARDLMNRIAQIRADTTLSEAAHIDQLMALPNLALNEINAHHILTVDDTAWARIDTQVIMLLDEVLRFPIRPDNLDGVKAQLPTRISLNFNADQSSVITALASALLVPNTNYDAAATDAARRKAREGVRPVERTFEQNQVIIRSGQLISQADMEVLDKLAIRRPAMNLSDLLSALVYSAITVAAIAGAMFYGKPGLFDMRMRTTALSAIAFVGALFLARVFLPGHALLPYVAPLTAISIIITAWSGTLPGIVSAVALAGLIGLGMDPPNGYVIFWASSGIVAALFVRRSERISDFLRAGVLAWLTQLGVLVAVNAGAMALDGASPLANMALVTTVGSLVSAALAPMMLYICGLLLDMTTPFQLQELSRPSHPLIQQMLMQAPGTYHHSLMLANLAEQAAERIGADSLLTRIGAYYHDIGKTLHPYFFIENQIDRTNVHDQLDPLTSSRILQNHVTDGLDLARKYRLPSRIRAFIAEHHGTTKTGYQYARAVQASSEPVDDAPFRYPGPRPQTRESALVMLADGCEAMVRARKPVALEDTDSLVRKLIAERIADHQLDDSNLTLQDLENIRQSFVDTLRGAYHPRIEYPDMVKAPKQESLPAERLQETAPVVSVPSENAQV
jgi:putative nucleotidyltransferase with HDIG domain